MTVFQSLRLVYDRSGPASTCPYRIVATNDKPVGWINDFLNAQYLRALSLRSLRAYGYDLLNFIRWSPHASRQSLSTLNESRLLDYVRYQLEHRPKPSAATVNHRLAVIRALYRFYFIEEIPKSRATVQARTPLKFGHSSRLVGLRLRQPRQIVMPLRVEEISRFWSSFRTYRDFSLVGLMLFNGLRSQETIQLQLEDLRLSEAQMFVQGKGNRQRVLPLADDIIQVLQRYLEFERPSSESASLFLSLKGRQRGRPMTPAGLRSLFRHHRHTCQIPNARPHRFRHTFGSDMIRAGVSLPALMRLMGHSQIHTTMIYVQLSPQDVWREYHRALEKRSQDLTKLRRALSDE